MIPAIVMLLRGGSKIWHRPDWPELRRLFRVALNHNWLNLAIVTPGRVIPVIVTLVVSPSANGVFYIAWMIVSFLFMVPVHLSTVLFAIASASPELIAEKLRFVLRVSLLIGLPVMAVLAVSAHFALSLFGPELRADGHRAAVAARHRLHPADAQGPVHRGLPGDQQGGQGRGPALRDRVCEIMAITIGGKLGGLDGLSFAYLGVLIFEGLITAPTVLRAAYARTAAGTGAFPAIPATARTTGALRPATGPLARVTGELVKLTGALTTLPGAPDRQETGLAALLALASAAVSDGHTLDVATEVWRTGAFPALPADVTGPRRVQNAVTTLDLLGGQSAAGIPCRPRDGPGSSATGTGSRPASTRSSPSLPQSRRRKSRPEEPR